MNETVTFTPEKLKKFKKVYDQHKSDKEATFEFEGKEYLVGYAKYLIEYLDGEMGKASGGE